MPTYCFECSKCKKTKDEFHTMQKVPEFIKCKCGEKMKKQFGSGTGFIFTENFYKIKRR
jgi:putative FmdB family regulatory protein